MNEKTIKVPATLHREAAITRGDAGAPESVSISSNTPYLRYDWWSGEEYYEVLDHSPGGMDDTRLRAGLPILFNHDRNQHLARATEFQNDGSKITLPLDGFIWASSQMAKEKKADMESGALPDTSVGYELVGDGKCIGQRDGIPVYQFRWNLLEASAVTIPADTSVGVGRQRSQKTAEEKENSVVIKICIDNLNPQPLIPNMPEEPTSVVTPEPIETRTAASAPPAAVVAPVDADSIRHESEKAERKRTTDILDWSAEISKLRNIDLSESALSHVRDGKSLNDFREHVLRTEFKSKPLQTAGATPDAPSGMKRDAFTSLSPKAQRDFCLSGGKITD